MKPLAETFLQETALAFRHFIIIKNAASFTNHTAFTIS